MDKLYYGSGRCTIETSQIVGLQISYRGKIKIDDKTEQSHALMANDKMIIIFPISKMNVLSELFEYSGERLNTGFSEVDVIETSFSTDIYVDVQLTTEDGITALFTEDNIRILSEDEDRSDDSTIATKDFDTVTDSDNVQIEKDADAILDFSDADPFSEGGNF